MWTIFCSDSYGFCRTNRSELQLSFSSTAGSVLTTGIAFNNGVRTTKFVLKVVGKHGKE
jgi:hypothetical protein